MKKNTTFVAYFGNHNINNGIQARKQRFFVVFLHHLCIIIQKAESISSPF